MINFLLMVCIILLILKLIFYKNKNEPFDPSILNCKKYKYLCNEKQPTKYSSQYFDKRPDYLPYLDKISPRYNSSSRFNVSSSSRNINRNKNKNVNKLILTTRRIYDPHDS